MRVGDLIDVLAKFPRDKVITIMLPSYAKDIPVEVVSVFDGAYLPADALVSRDDIVVIRSASR